MLSLEKLADNTTLMGVYSLGYSMKTELPIQGDTVLIIGNWSYKNMGDELILLGTIRLLQKQGKKIIISAYNPQRLKHFFSQFKDIKKLNIIHEFPKGFRSAFRYFFSPRIKELKSYREADSVIIGGGEILTEESKNSYWYWNLSLLPLLWKLKSISLYLMGGIQIPKQKKNLIFFNRLLKKVKYIFARDHESVLALKKFGYSNCEFFMDTSRFAYPWRNIKKTAETKTIFINLNKNGESFFEELVQECKTFLATGYTLKYVAVSKGENATYNDLYYKELLEQRLSISLETLDWESDFSAFVQELKNAEMVITARLHLFLVASFLGVKTKVFPYQKKIIKMQKIIKEIEL